MKTSEERVFRGLRKACVITRGHPEEADDPLTDIFRDLMLNGYGRLWARGVKLGAPFWLLGALGVNCGCGDCAGVLGLGNDEDVEGTPAGLLALSLAKSLSGPDRPVLFGASGCVGLSFIFLQLGLTRYFKGNGPFFKRKKFEV